MSGEKLTYNKPELREIPLVDAEEAGVKFRDMGFKVTPPEKIEGSEEEKFLQRTFAKYLSKPLITDNFTDHRHERRVWEKKQTEEIKRFFKDNRINLTALGLVAGAIKVWTESEDDENIPAPLRTEADNMANFLIGLRDTIMEYTTLDGERVDPESLTPEDLARAETKWEEDPIEYYDKFTLEEKLEIVDRVTWFARSYLISKGYTIT